MEDLLAAVPLGADAKARVHTLMSGPDRFYHGVDHVALLWRRHGLHAREAGFAGVRETRLTACAIAFHDCIYDGGRADNEERSAQAWLEASADADFDAADREWVAATIRATRDHLGYGAASRPEIAAGGAEALRLWMLDLDLTPFGETPDVFDRNTGLLRQEAPQLADDAFEAARLGLLRRFSAAPVIFRTPAIAARFDAPARANIARHLQTHSRTTTRREDDR